MSDTSLHGHDADLVRNLYALLIDWDSRNSEGVKAAQNAFNIINSLSSIDELTAYLASRDVRAKGRPSLYDAEVIADKNDTNYYCLYIGSAELGWATPQSTNPSLKTAKGRRRQTML